MNTLLESISTQAAIDLKAQINDASEDLLAAIRKMESEAQLQDTAPKFSIGFKIVLDFDKHQFDCDLSWTVKQSLSTSHQIEDPNQEKLPIEDETFTKKVDRVITKSVDDANKKHGTNIKLQRNVKLAILKKITHDNE